MMSYMKRMIGKARHQAGNHTGKPAFGGMRLFALMIVALLGCGPSVMAEDSSSAGTFFLQDRQKPAVQRLQPQRPARAAQPISPRPALARDPGSRPGAPGGKIPVLAAGSAPPAAPSLFVAVLGDSLGVMLAQGLQEAYAERPEISVARKARESSGLVREDYYDWPKAVTDLLASPEHIDVAVMMIGSNDRQEIQDKIAPAPFRVADGAAISKEWLEIYGNRVEALAAKFKEKRIPLIWVGMPVMKNERMSAELVQLNEIFRTRAGKAGAVYIDVWEVFLNDASKFDAFGPDLNGETVKLRTADGIHFTKAGARKLAHFAEAELKRVFDQLKPTDAPQSAGLPDAVTPVLQSSLPEAAPHAPDPPAPRLEGPGDMDINVILRRQMGEPAGALQPGLAAPDTNIAIVSLPLPAEPAPLFVPLRPLAGPVVKLTALPLAPGGELASSKTGAAAAAGEAQMLVDRAFALGQLPKPRPGRADDFFRLQR